MFQIIYDESIPYIKDRFNQKHIQLLPRSVDQIRQKENFPSKADALIIRSNVPVTQKLLNGISVKVIATASAGTNHIDFAACGNNNVHIFDAKSANASAVADYILSSFLSIANNLNQSKLKVGIVGYGNIGKIVHTRFASLGYHCILHDPFVLKNTQFDAILACDVITFHVPLTKEGSYPTFHMLNQSQLKKIKPDTILINTSRGEVIDEQALLERMKNHNDLKLILDVWENEPHINNELVYYCKISTPHIAGWSDTARRNMAEILYNKMAKHFHWPKQLNFQSLGSNREVHQYNNDNRISDITYLMLITSSIVPISQTSQLFRQLIFALHLPTAEAFSAIQSKYEDRTQLLDCSLPSSNFFNVFRLNHKVRDIYNRPLCKL